MRKQIARPLLEGTRGAIIRRLRRRPCSVMDLTAELEVTESAVRAQLSRLEASGLAERAGKRPGTRKPEDLYRLTRDAEQLFPRTYGPLLKQLMDVLRERIKEDDLIAAMDEVALRIAAEFAPSTGGDAMQRAEHATEVVESLGGAAEVEESDDTIDIRGWRCPFGEVSPWHPELCHLVEVLLSETTGLALREHCDRNPEAPRCTFSVADAEI